MINDNEQSLQRRPKGLPTFLPVTSSEGQESQPGRFGDMVALVLKDLKSLPEVRSKEDLPDDIAYLLSRDAGFLIKFIRRRPLPEQPNRFMKEFTFSYFVEAQELDKEGNPQQAIHDPSRISQGMYERVDVSDEVDSRKFGLYPTRYDRARREYALTQLTPPKELLLSPLEGQETGIVSQLLVRASQVSQIKNLEGELREIIRKYHRVDRERLQGMSDEIGNAHLIVSDRGEDNPLFQISKRLGFNTVVIPYSKAVFDLSYVLTPEDIISAGMEDYLKDQDYIGDFKREYGIYPLVVTIDLKNVPVLGNIIDNSIASVLRENALNQRREHPVFSLIEIPSQVESEARRSGFSGGIRFDAGWYFLHGEDTISTEGMLIKLATDFTLTKQVRAIVPIL